VRAVVLAARGLAVLLLALTAVRLTGWSRGPAVALLLVALPLVLLPAYLLAGLALVARDRLLAAASALLVAAHLVVVAPGLGAAARPDDGAPRFRLVTANLLFDNRRPTELVAALRALHPDVLVAVELRPPLLEAMRAGGLLDDLPYSTVQGRPHDVELLSRLPLTDLGRATDVAALPQPEAVVTVAGVRVQLRGAHPLPPLAGSEDVGRAVHAGLRRDVRRDTLPVVVAGDLNGDRDSPLVGHLLRAGLRDAAEERGRGWAGTWPARLPVLALDHVLVRDGDGGRLVVAGQREAVLPGSDHRAVVADVAVLDRRQGRTTARR
jgi:endonuclease/exonuclease/phosphatase (EEP) superfamily protein YafD